jgi:hypothetical protein
MTDSTNEQPAASKIPTHIVYHVRDRAGSKSRWTRIGSAWAHKDGNGFNIKIDAMPLHGRITVRVPSDKSE